MPDWSNGAFGGGLVPVLVLENRAPFEDEDEDDSLRAAFGQKMLAAPGRFRQTRTAFPQR